MITLKKIALAEPKTSFVQKIFRWLLGLSLLYAGISHLTFARQEFLAQVPRWVPLSGDLVVVLSGIVEVTLGAALVVVSKYRAALGWISAAFFIAVFPGNIAQYLNRIDAFGMTTDTARLIRLFFQPLLVLWALWSTGAWSAWRHRDDKLSSGD
jgi:uncharacterized membrane protein